MPDLTTPQSSEPGAVQGESENWLVIPADLMAQLMANGYTGSAVVRKNFLDELLKQYGGNPNDPGSPPPGYPPGGGYGGGGGYSAQDLANLRASFMEVLHAWGFTDPTKNLLNLVDQAVNQKMSTTNFIQHLRQTKEYKQNFAGIKKGMSEASYLTYYNWYADKAKDVGLDLTRQAFGTLLNKGIDQSEWSERVAATKQVLDNKDLLNSFEQVLKYRGMIKPKENVNFKDWADFVRGSGSKAWEAVWEEASATAQLENIGVDVTKKGNGNTLGRRELVKMINDWESRNPGKEFEAMGDDFYQQLADDITKLIPASKMAGFNLVEKDLVEMRLGGPRREEIAQRVQVVLNKIKGMSQDVVNPESGLTQQGFRLVTGAQERAQAQ